ncbi:hypothetical protein MARI151_20131 [Maribacter litoralis]|uniref:Uncharacterized protein n=1 Tax=Maribacter litoralis TaxID=2059726 RepID=A0A653P6D0_9FLAO|nr:hypothetical protein MARI151_20131 [Maribacter litoralis]
MGVAVYMKKDENDGGEDGFHRDG